jgi:hypothetical protein
MSFDYTVLAMLFVLAYQQYRIAEDNWKNFDRLMKAIQGDVG